MPVRLGNRTYRTYESGYAEQDAPATSLRVQLNSRGAIMEAKEGRITKNHQVLWATLITLVVGIFAFAQVYIVIALNQMDDRITRLDDRVNERLTQIENQVNGRLMQIENRLDKLNQNYIDHLKHHVQDK